ncbi:alanine/glycine:cation symporter family protein [Miniphocaeibacter massiliensis]|uniref:alanine/glycine:cation symporter family protein n=1 Tax=Miniphocaeibacter massiliensis TaxID=2041841 RepID=UPI000C1C671D|nr:sodium:alanine symporter family protein [Miniphocaeibacter massiliensis]
MDYLAKMIESINKVLVDNVLMYVLPLVGIFFTLYLGFPQIRRFPAAIKQTFGGLFDKEENARKKAAGEISSFQALAVAIAAQVGTGNVAGVATAIMAGGPGAIFWMWLSAFFGMSTIFVEAILAQKYRTKDKEGNLVGGPAYYISQGFKHKGIGKFLAGFFAVAIILALGFIGNMVQSNSISTSIHTAFNIPLWIVGVAIAILAGLVFIGGIKRIASFAEMVVPVMAIIYIALAVAIMVIFRNEVGSVFKLIFTEAFSFKAVGGGAAGIIIKEAMRYGVARGLFSNEAGMGSTPQAHATAHVKHPAEQGLTAMVGVVVDTGLVCTATALIILVTGAANISGLDGALVTQKAFELAFGKTGQILLTICLTFFAFTTVVGWYYFGETNVKYLFGEKGLWPYRILVLAFIVIGSALKVTLVWNMADMFNTIMVLPNLIGIMVLFKQAKAITKDYDRCRKLGKIEYNYEYE